MDKDKDKDEDKEVEEIRNPKSQIRNCVSSPLTQGYSIARC